MLRRDDLSNRSINSIKISGNETVELNQPKSKNAEHPFIRNRIGEQSLEINVAYEILDTKSLTPEGVTRTSDAKYVMENSLNSSNYLAHALANTLPSLLHNKIHRGSCHTCEIAASLMLQFKPNYYHWFVECVPRLRGVRAFEKLNSCEVELLIPPNPPSWMEKSLKIMNHWRQCIEHHSNVKVNRMIIPQSAKSGRYIRSSQVQWVKQQLMSNITLDSDLNYSSHIYLSREDSSKKTRRVLNRQELLRKLPHVFESYKLEQMSLEEQIKLFSGADVVVAPHGAGLANIMWGDSIEILELWGEKRVNDCYWQLASSLGHQYHHHKCKSVAKDLLIDTATLETQIDDIMYDHST